MRATSASAELSIALISPGIDFQPLPPLSARSPRYFSLVIRAQINTSSRSGVPRGAWAGRWSGDCCGSGSSSASQIHPKLMDHGPELSTVQPHTPHVPWAGTRVGVGSWNGLEEDSLFPLAPWNGASLAALETAGCPGLAAVCSRSPKNEEPALEASPCLLPHPNPWEKSSRNWGAPPAPHSTIPPPPLQIQDGCSGALERNKQTNTQTPLLVPSATGGTKPCSQGPSSE